MNDPLQQAMQNLATENNVTRAVFVFFAAVLIYFLGAGWLVTAIVRRAQLTPATVLRLLLLAILTYVASKLLAHVIIDPRPYIVEHTQPLTPTASDNGFPSDHTLLAGLITASLWWLARRLLPLFAVGTLLLMLGRLGIGAHHTIDVLGSVLIVLVLTVLVAWLPLPARWASWRSPSSIAAQQP